MKLPIVNFHLLQNWKHQSIEIVLVMQLVSIEFIIALFCDKVFVFAFNNLTGIIESIFSLYSVIRLRLTSKRWHFL